jgi:hypothetical protein
MRRCNRFRRDGSACTNETDNSDGWCRQADCQGFPRPDPPQAPESAADTHATAKHIPKTEGLAPGDITVEDAPYIDVATSAIDKFRFHHGGSVREAEVQLRNMLEDFLLKSAPKKPDSGHLVLGREGYYLTLSPSRDEITDYSTKHRERTWEQFKAGVLSRISSKNRWGPSGLAPERGAVVVLSGFRTAFDPATVHLTATVRRRYAKIAELDSASDEELDTAIRAVLTGLTSGKVVPLDDACFGVHDADRIWVVSSDCRSIYGIKDATLPHPSGTATPLDDLGTTTTFERRGEL